MIATIDDLEEHGGGHEGRDDRDFLGPAFGGGRADRLLLHHGLVELARDLCTRRAAPMAAPTRRVEAQLRVEIGTALYSLGKIEEARAEFEPSLRVLDAEWGPAPSRAGGSTSLSP